MDTDDLIAQEYFHLQKVVEDYDAKALTTKAWSVTFSAAAIGFAFDKHESVILIVSVATALAFWLVEALIKVNQQAYYPRIREIEKQFESGERRAPMQIGRAWSAAFRASGQYRLAFEILLWPHVFMPHLAIAGLGFALLILHPPETANNKPSSIGAQGQKMAGRPAAPVSDVVAIKGPNERARPSGN